MGSRKRILLFITLLVAAWPTLRRFDPALIQPDRWRRNWPTIRALFWQQFGGLGFVRRSPDLNGPTGWLAFFHNLIEILRSDEPAPNDDHHS